ncbi:MAG TPA: ParB/RepB/Spo0J family partition protein [Candidatus Acidoferrum sp.]|nr:ParB/RepB/Spo0J family partition protein [Candidatus Acidoferrum sp.]
MSQDAGKRLGRGLSALLGEAAAEPQQAQRATRTLTLDQLVPGPFQPRHRFDDESLAALADSIRENGVLQPILVRPRPGAATGYEIVAGERRWRAAQLAKLHEIPVIVREISDREALELALIENVQREDLSPLEEADGYRRLLQEFGNSQDDLARRVGKSRSHITNSIRLLGLPEPVRQLLDDGKLSSGHARALLGTADAVGLANLIVAHDLNVRQTERLVKSHREGGPRLRRPPKDADTRALERDITARLGLTVSVDQRGEGGTVTIRYQTLEQLDLILARLRAEAPSQVH